MAELWNSRVTDKTLLGIILKMGHNTVVLWTSHAACGGGYQLISTTNQKVPSGGITTTPVTLGVAILTDNLIN